MEAQLCVVTGANAGIGKATALGLAERGMTVVMVCRSRERGQAAQAEIIERSGNSAVDLLLADLSSQQQIRQLTADFKEKYQQLDVLINNAGIIPRQRQETEDGLEMQFAVNHLAPFLLTNLLLGVLKASAPARVINVSSMTHKGTSIAFDDLQSQKRYDPRQAYARSKLANVLFTYELARRLEGTGVTANCLHPGVIPTKLNANYMGRSGSRETPPEAAARGAETSIYLAMSPEVEGVSGKYFANKSEARSSAVSYDEELARRLWQVSAELTGLADRTQVPGT